MISSSGGECSFEATSLALRVWSGVKSSITIGTVKTIVLAVELLSIEAFTRLSKQQDEADAPDCRERDSSPDAVSFSWAMPWQPGCCDCASPGAAAGDANASGLNPL